MILSDKIDDNIIFSEDNINIYTTNNNIFESNKENILRFIRMNNIDDSLIIENDEQTIKFEIVEINFKCSLNITFRFKNGVSAVIDNVSIDSFMKILH